MGQKKNILLVSSQFLKQWSSDILQSRLYWWMDRDGLRYGPALAGGSEGQGESGGDGSLGGPWVDPGRSVWALWAEGNDAGCDSILILLLEAVGLNLLLLPPSPPSPPVWLLLRPLSGLILSLSQGARGWRKKKGPRKEQWKSFYLAKRGMCREMW